MIRARCRTSRPSCGCQRHDPRATPQPARLSDVRLRLRPAPLRRDVSFFPGTDRLAEIFLGNGRAGSDIDAAAKDSAVVASIALQHGVPVDVIRKALLRDSQGKASSPLGGALDAIAEQEGE